MSAAARGLLTPGKARILHDAIAQYEAASAQIAADFAALSSRCPQLQTSAAKAQLINTAAQVAAGAEPSVAGPMRQSAREPLALLQFPGPFQLPGTQVAAALRTELLRWLVGCNKSEPNLLETSDVADLIDWWEGAWVCPSCAAEFKSAVSCGAFVKPPQSVCVSPPIVPARTHFVCSMACTKTSDSLTIGKQAQWLLKRNHLRV